MKWAAVMAPSGMSLVHGSVKRIMMDSVVRLTVRRFLAWCSKRRRYYAKSVQIFDASKRLRLTARRCRSSYLVLALVDRKDKSHRHRSASGDGRTRSD